MLPIQRLQRLTSRAAATALAQLDKVTTPLPTRVVTVTAADALTDEEVKRQQKLLAKSRRKQARPASYQDGANALAALAAAAAAEQQQMQQQQMQQILSPASATTTTTSESVATETTTTSISTNNIKEFFITNPNAPLTITQLQSASTIAHFAENLILHVYSLESGDRALWLQLKALAIRALPHASSAGIVTMLECLARKCVIGPVECKAFQTQLGSDVSALAPTDILRFAAACLLAGAPLQQNMKDALIGGNNAVRWVQNTALAPVWWIVADIVEQLPLDTRRSVAFALVTSLEQIRSESSNHGGSSNELHQLWPNCDRDTAFILFRLRSTGALSLTPTGVPRDANPVYTDSLLKTIRVDKLPDARSAVLLMRALCLGSEEMSPTTAPAGIVIAEDLCRLVYNNVTQERIQSAPVLVSLIHSLASDRLMSATSSTDASSSSSSAVAIPTAALAGLETSLVYLKRHSHTMVRETLMAMLKIFVAAASSSSSASNSSLDSTRQLVSIRLKGSLRRIVLVTAPGDALYELLALSDRAGILDVHTADFALQMMLTHHAAAHEIRRCTTLVQNMVARLSPGEQKEFLKSSVFGSAGTNNSSNSNNSDSTKAAAATATASPSLFLSRVSLVTNWTEIRNLPAPRIAFFAATAAKALFCDPAGLQSNALMSPNSQAVPTTSIMLGATTTTPTQTPATASSNSKQQRIVSSAASGATMSTSTATSLDGGLVGLCSAESEIVQAHRGVKALSASDCALLVAATTMLPAEARSLVLRDDSQQLQYHYSSNNSEDNNTTMIGGRRWTPRSRVVLLTKNNNQEDESGEKQQHEATTEGDSVAAAAILRHPLFVELKSCTVFLEAQATVNTSLELNQGADAVVFAAAQQRLSRLLHLAHPAPFDFVHPVWTSWCGRLVSAIAQHRLANFRLPLWLMHVFCEKVPDVLVREMSAIAGDDAATTVSFRALRALYACAFFGIDRPATVEPLVRVALLLSSTSSTVPSSLVAPRGMLHLLRMLEHVGQRAEFVKEIHGACEKRVEEWLDEATKQVALLTQESQSATTAAATAAGEQHQPQQQPDKKTVSPLSSSTSSSPSASSPFTSRERRRLLDVLCCAALLDTQPQKYKHLIEHLHPFDTALYPLPDSIFFFGVASQRKRLSGFALRVWRTLAMQLDKVSVTGSETLSLSPNGASCILSQTGVILHPTFTAIGYFIANGGGSASVDLLLEKLKKLQPIDPLLLARLIRVALHPVSVKVRPALSQMLCRAFDLTVAASMTATDLVIILETFHVNNAQRVAVGLIQADAAVAIAWEALGVRIVQQEEEEQGHEQQPSAAVCDDLFLRATAVPCPVGSVAVQIVQRLVVVAKKRGAAAVQADRERFTPVLFSTVIKHINEIQKHDEQQQQQNAEDLTSSVAAGCGALWNDLKQFVIKPIEESSTNIAEKETLEELLSL